MKKQHLYSCLTLVALMGFWSCSSSLQTAQNAGNADDLYGGSGDAEVYASNRPLDDGYSNSRSSRQQQRALRNANPDYNDEQQGYDANTNEYYSELSTRKLNRGLSADPGWNDTGANAYTSGFSNGYNSAMTSAYSWNRWGFNNTGFYNGLGLGIGLGSFGFGSPFYGSSFGYSPFYGSSFGYSPFSSPFGYGGYGNGFYDPFYSSYAYGGFGGYSPFYSPFGYGGGYGGYYGSPVYINNGYAVGADPYRSNRTYGPRFNNSGNNGTIARGYNNNFVNTPRSGNTTSGGRSGYSSGAGNRGSNDGYYAAPRSNSRGSYYYDNGSSAGGRAGANSAVTNNTAPSYNSSRGSNNGYYAAPRSNSRGSYTPADGNYSGGRGSYQQAQPSYQQPSYQSQNRSFSQPSFSQPSYSAPSRGFSAPSGGGGGFSGGGGHVGGGGGRGPR